MAHEDRREPESIWEATTKLLAYCKANRWMGYDPYDALNSEVFKALPFMDFRLARLVLTQAVKRCPINLRPLLLIRKTLNAKGIALFLSSLARLSRAGMVDGSAELPPLAQTLLALRIPGRCQSCWGYSFDWQSRATLIPRESPNIICSTFAANALLDAYETSGNASWFDAARSTADFILADLFHRGDGSLVHFRYAANQWVPIHNANLFGAALASRIGCLTGEDAYLGPALEAARYSVSKQREDGSWPYGESSSRQWIDNFHTGFNLIALQGIGENTRTSEFDAALRKGLGFYKAHFFQPDGAPRYFHDETYPIDIHSVAQGVITLIELKDYGEDLVPLAIDVLRWGLNNMWDRRGYFYFQKHRKYTVRTPFMRWSQAWMLLALSTVLQDREA